MPVCVNDINTAFQVTDGSVHKLIDDPPGFHVTSSSGNHVDSQQVCYQRPLLMLYTKYEVGLGSCIRCMRARPVYSFNGCVPFIFIKNGLHLHVNSTLVCHPGLMTHKGNR